MTTPTAQPLVAAIAAGLTSAGVAFGDGRKPTVAAGKPWVVGWFAPTIDDRSLRSRDGWVCVVTFQCFGLTPESARIASRAVSSVLLGMHRTTVGGRTVQLPENLSSVQGRDDDTEPPTHMVAEDWRIRTTAA